MNPPQVVSGPCLALTGLACPAHDCPGRADPAFCAARARLEAWRRLTPGDQALAARARLDPRVRDAVRDCPDRGPVLPISEQDDCGCRGRERSRCRAGRGADPGRVTLDDCLGCRSAALGPSIPG